MGGCDPPGLTRDIQGEGVTMLDREKLQEIRAAAQEEAEIACNPLWVDALTDLANAADRVDAMTARCEVREL